MSYINSTTITLIGGLCGFIAFVFYLESPDMGNIVIRDGRISPANIFAYMTNPFSTRYLWYPDLWRANWIISSVTGIMIGYAVARYLC